MTTTYGTGKTTLGLGQEQECGEVILHSSFKKKDA